MANDPFKYAAFISYSHADEVWAKWLHQKLERYRIPSRLVGKQTSQGTVPRRIGRCFRDQAELSAASHLGETLQQALRDSRTLIIVCSPRSATSHWVNEEIKYFRNLGRADQIYALIVDGHPKAKNPAQECFPPALRDDHPLAADARESADGKADGFLKLTAGILGLGFDELRQRERWRRTRLMIATVGVSLSIAAMTTILAISAYHARNEAQQRRQQADDLINFMLGDLQDHLRQVGRLDVLDSTVKKAVAYVGAGEIKDLDDEALAERIEALNQVGVIQMARGQLDQAISTGHADVDAARELQKRHDDVRSRKLLAKATYFLANAAADAGDYATGEGLFTEGIKLTQDLLALQPTDPELVVLVSQYDSSIAGNDDFGPHRNEADSDAHLRDCIDRLRPQTDKSVTSPAALEQLIECEHTRLVHLFQVNRFDDAKKAASDFVSDAEALYRQYADVAFLQYGLLAGLGPAATELDRLGETDTADHASSLALQIGRELTTLEPANIEWLQSYAAALLFDISVRLSQEAWDAARADADQGLPLMMTALEHHPDDVSTRLEVIQFRDRLADIDFRTNRKAEALDEVAAGLKLMRDTDQSTTMLEEGKLPLLARQWFYAIGINRDVARQAQNDMEQLLAQLSTRSDAHRVSMYTLVADYFGGHCAEGDQLREKLTSEHQLPDPAGAQKYRDAGCGNAAVRRRAAAK